MEFEQLTAEGGYLNSECTAMQKCIRRGLEEEALFWATELDLAGYGAYVWKRQARRAAGNGHEEPDLDE